MKSTKSLNLINRRRLLKRPPTFNKIPTRGHVSRYSNWEVDIDWNHVFTFLIVLAYHLPDKQQFEGYLAEINLCIKHQYYDIPDDVVTRFSEFELEYSHLV